MPRPSNTAERRTQIARALLKVMAKSGYEGASVADVAKVAKIAPGLVHYHFKNKLEILLAAIDELAADYEERLDRHLKTADGDPEKELRKFVDAHLHTGSEADPEALACWIDISGESLREPRVKKAFARVMANSAARVGDILERGTALEIFACKEPEVAAAAILATIQGYFVLGANAREVIPSGSAARATMAMCEGLVAPASPTRTPRGKGRR
jgi:TetR/AcrR family transcriptional regulator, transcriptional repressor of bet genes